MEPKPLLEVGKTYKVTKRRYGHVTSSYCDFIDNHGYSYKFEKVPETDLKPGDKVHAWDDEDDCKWQVTYLCTNEHGLHLCITSDIPHLWDTKDPTTDQGRIYFWRHVEKVKDNTKEMTMAELEKALGHKVKIIKE